MTKIGLFILLSSILLIGSLADNELSDTSFSGFVETTEENVDFSRIEIHLLADSGRLIEKTFCSANGFYLLPINEPRNYLIRVFSPDNLSFEPESRLLPLQDKSEAEIKLILEHTDANFRFIGFTIKGQVHSQNGNDGSGPKGIKLGLYNSMEKLVAEGVSEDSGHFVFQKLVAGIYSIEALENKEVKGYTLSKTEKRLRCEVSWGRHLSCQGRIVISGYDVSGRVLNEESPLQNFYLFLYERSPGHNPAYPCPKPEVNNHPLAIKGQKYLCYEVSKSDGSFFFPSLSFGDYQLSIKSMDKEKKAEIEPNEVALKVRHSPVQEALQFQVNRFSLQGRVVDTLGTGIPNVTISLDGEEKTRTDIEGFYSLERIKSGTYTLEGLHDHLFFEPIHELKLSIGLTQIPSLVLTYLHICGQVLLNFDNLFQENAESPRFKITMFLEDAKSEKRTTFPDISGAYCFEAKPGNYTIYPVIDKTLTDITFSPAKQTIQILNKPRLDLDFHRPRVSIQGQVHFLVGLTKELKEKTKVKITSLGNQRTLAYELSPSGEFLINNVFSGNYELSIENDGLCWEKSSIPLEIHQNSNITGVKFQQVGWALRYEVSNDVTAEVHKPSGSHEIWTFSAQSNHKCLHETGEYQIMPDDCSSYSESKFVYKTDTGEKLVLVPEKHLISGEVRFKLEKTTITKEALDKLPSAIVQMNHLKVISHSFDKSSVLEQTEVPFTFQKKASNKDALVFTYRHYVKSFTLNEIVPIRNDSAIEPSLQSLIENLIFYPQTREIAISQSCQKTETNFTIKAGLILTGALSPEGLDEVSITVFQDNKAIESLVLNGSTFRVGPLSDASEYRVEATKPNYKFIQQGATLQDNVMNFLLVAQRLSMIKVIVVDAENKPITGVSVFISSTARNEKLKLNNITDERGLFVSNNLVKGEYMVKCSLKEYSFDPSQKTVRINEGDHTEISFTGKQIAFSLFGRVLKLSQEGLDGAMVDVLEDGKLKDSIKTSAGGVFRIRALEPFRHYQLSLRVQDNVHYYKPQTLEVDMKDHDVTDLEFIVFEKRQKYTIMGTIDFDDRFSREESEEIHGFEVELFDYKDQQTPLADVRRLLVNRYFEFEDVAHKEYVVKLSYKRSKNALTQEIAKIYNLKELAVNEFKLEKKIVITKTGLENKKGKEQTFSLLAPVVLLILLISLLNIDTTKEVIGSVVGFFKKK